MATPLSGQAIKIFDDQVKQDYQEKGFTLSQAVRTKSGNAKSFMFPVYGKLQAVEHIVGTKVTHQMATQAQKEIIIKNWIVSSPTDVFEQSQVNYDDISEAAQAQAMAMGRRSDQLILDALNNTTSPLAVAVGTDGLTVAKIKKACALLDKSSVPSSDRFIAAHTNGKEVLLSSAETTSSDYSNIRALVNGDIDTFYGFKIIWIGDMAEGGIPLSTHTRKNFAWHKAAVGYAQSMDVSSRTDYAPDYACNIVASTFAANAGEIDPKGIVVLNTYE